MGARPSSFVKEPKEQEQAESVQNVQGRVWSDQQNLIFDWFEGGDIAAMYPVGHDPTKFHLVVRARAGTGKTTTIIEGVNRAPEDAILVCAFNKKIAEELNSRITNGSAEAKTLHAIGYAAIREQWYRMPVCTTGARGDQLTDAVCVPGVPKPIRRLITLLHTKARDMMPLIGSLQAFVDLALFFDYVPDENWAQTPRASVVGELATSRLFYDLEFVAGRALAAVRQAATAAPTVSVGIDFADMIFLPLVWKLLHPLYDLGVCDEAQDMTLAQLEMFQRVVSGRKCIVGDDRQAIYAFRGADSGSLDRLKDELGAEELPLTVTYRCAQSVVRRAQRLVPDIIADPANPEGLVDTCAFEDLFEQAAPGDFILSRLNAPLVTITLGLLRRKKRARMAGRDIGAGIQTVLRKLNTPANLDILIDRLTAWEVKTCTRLATYGQLALVDRCHDQADMIRALVEDANTVQDIYDQCTYLFTDEPDAAHILCASIHKAKGLEAQRVFMLSESLYRRDITQEEQNLDYVSTTRAKSHLTLVTGVPSLQRRSL